MISELYIQAMLLCLLGGEWERMCLAVIGHREHDAGLGVGAEVPKQLVIYCIHDRLHAII